MQLEQRFMADNRTANDVAFDEYLRRGAELAHEASILPEYQPPPYPASHGRLIKSPTYVPPDDRAARVAAARQEGFRVDRDLRARERQSQLIRYGLPNDLSKATCAQLRSAHVMISQKSKLRSELEGRSLMELSYDVNWQIGRRCVPQSQRGTY